MSVRNRTLVHTSKTAVCMDMGDASRWTSLSFCDSASILVLSESKLFIRAPFQQT